MEQPAVGLLEQLRHYELQCVRPYLEPGMRVLELGGGSGYQASLISSWGCHVESIDLADRRPSEVMYFPVQNYDGLNIPFPDAAFDAVFSSNVLEHIAHLPAILRELRRVLAPGGTALHILPSSTWRLWTSVTHYPGLVKFLVGRDPIPGITSVRTPKNVLGHYGWKAALGRAVFPGPHGAYSSAWAELRYYSRRRWTRVFAENLFRVEEVSGTRIFYTGNAILPGISLDVRRRLASVLGNACYLYRLTPLPPRDSALAASADETTGALNGYLP